MLPCLQHEPALFPDPGQTAHIVWRCRVWPWPGLPALSARWRLAGTGCLHYMFVTYDFDQRQTYPGQSLLAVSNTVALGIILKLIDPILYVERFLSRASVCL